MPPSRRPLRSRRSLLRAAPLLLALPACRLGDDPVQGDSQPRLDLSVQVLDVGDTVPPATFAYPPQPVRLAPAGGLVVARGFLWRGATGGRLRRVTDGRLVINGTGIDGRIPAAQRNVEYAGEVAGRPADGVVTVTLPRIEGIEPVTLRLEGIAHAAGTTAELSGGDLRLRVIPPASRIAPPLMGARWTATVMRGDRTTHVDGASPIAREIVLPVSSILPGSGAVSARLLYNVFGSSSALRPYPSDTTYEYGVTLTSSVRFAPVAP